MKNEKNILLIALAIGIYYYMQQSKASAALPSTSISTDAKRQAIIVYWETFEPPSQQVNNPGFEDIINNITPTEVDTIYTYVFSYLAKGLQPTPGSAFAIQVNQIKTYYNIFS